MPPSKTRKWSHLISTLPLTTTVSLLGYASSYRRNTLSPIRRIINTVDDDSTKEEIDRWSRSKLKEAQYVQVAGAIMFASTISCLSWSNLSSSHWSGPALWYGSIILALMAVMLGAQQVMFVPDKFDGNAARDFRKRLMVRSREKMRAELEPRQSMLFAWQAPLMCLSCSVVFFHAGLLSVVISPLARKPGWGDEAKTFVLYMVVLVFALGTFVATSLSVHSLLEGHLGDAE